MAADEEERLLRWFGLLDDVELAHALEADGLTADFVADARQEVADLARRCIEYRGECIRLRDALKEADSYLEGCSCPTSECRGDCAGRTVRRALRTPSADTGRPACPHANTVSCGGCGSKICLAEGCMPDGCVACGASEEASHQGAP